MLYLIPTPIGNLEDISIRSLKLLSSCSTVFCEDSRVSKKLITLLKSRFDLNTNIKRYIPMHSHNEKSLLESLDISIFDEDVVYLSDAGMPCISDPGCHLIKFCQNNNIAYDVLPGPNAMSLAYTSSGFCSSKFLFYGFLPHRGHAREVELEQAMFSGYITILYESPHRVIKLLEQICSINDQQEIFLIKEATKLYQKTFRGSAKELLDILQKQTIKGEWVVVLNSSTTSSGSITISDIKSLDISKKQMSKLIAKITGESTKECYSRLIS
jgi:16S rRNA (cytidine1402-2'-O)-methyltransferase